jgi:hypothetical protein
LFNAQAKKKRAGKYEVTPYFQTRVMKTNKILLAVFKTLGSMAAIFLLGYLGYHNPDAMVWVVTGAIFCALFYYFYSKNIED